LGELARQKDRRPAVPYTLTLKDSAKMHGLLPLNWDPRAERWYGTEGLDWHLRKTQVTE
jgi:hypothetical protein